MPRSEVAFYRQGKREAKLSDDALLPTSWSRVRKPMTTP